MDNKNQQINALLRVNALKFALETLGVTTMRNHKYSQVFTVTRAEIDAYVAEHGIPAGGYDPDPRSRTDGLHFFRKGDNWLLYFQERGTKQDLQTFTDEKEAQSALVDWLLKSNLTGIDFSK